MCTTVQATALLHFVPISRVTRYYAMPHFHAQNKPQGKTAIIIASSKGGWNGLKTVLKHPAVKEAVLSEDSLFSKVRVSRHHLFQP